MGLYLGLSFREQIEGKYGEPLVSELDQLVASIQEHLENVVQTSKSAISDDAASSKTIQIDAVQKGMANNLNSDEILWSYDLPNDTLSKDGDSLSIEVWGDTPTGNGGKKVEFWWNYVKVGAWPSVQTMSALKWRWRVTIIRTGGNLQQGHGEVQWHATSFGARYIFQWTGTAPSSSRINMQVTGHSQVSGPNAVTVEGVRVIKNGAPSAR